MTSKDTYYSFYVDINGRRKYVGADEFGNPTLVHIMGYAKQYTTFKLGLKDLKRFKPVNKSLKYILGYVRIEKNYEFKEVIE